MKKRIRRAICMLLVGSLFCLTGCSIADLFGDVGENGLLGGDTTEDGGSTDTGNKPGDSGSTDTGNKPGDSGSTDTGNKPGDGGSTDTGNKPGDGGSTDTENKPGDSGSTDAENKPDDNIGGEKEGLDFTPQPLIEQYGYQYFNGLTDGQKFCGFYEDLYEACCDLTVTEDVNPQRMLVNDGNGGSSEIDLYIVETLDWGKYGLTREEALTVWKVLRMEYPEFYWISNTVTQGAETLNLQIFEKYALGATRAEIQEDIESAVNECYGYIDEGMSDIEKALTVYDYIISSMEYAYKADGKTPEDAIWAHNIVGFAQGRKGVCETYAKTFEYIHSRLGIETITVSGKAGTSKYTMEDHAWNLMKIDGAWYAIDATWGDQENAAGEQSIHRDWFGKGATEFSKTHILDLPEVGYGAKWQYPAPPLSKNTLSPVRMQEKGKQAVFYGSIDYAFADMQETGEYTIALLTDTRVTSEKKVEIAFMEVSFSQAMPKAGKITFVGRYEQQDAVSYTVTPLRTEKEVTLQSNVHLQYVTWTYPSLYKNGYTVTTDRASYKTEIR